ncbi:hypothetical protein [Legionella busanensis]|uniref:hypothetical protein n=1 Tax=Legionella busanensis TaxID=190655 RepID=UPI000E1BA5E1|nr:hypothetical protein [Legionella busanensis]
MNAAIDIARANTEPLIFSQISESSKASEQEIKEVIKTTQQPSSTYLSTNATNLCKLGLFATVAVSIAALGTEVYFQKLQS